MNIMLRVLMDGQHTRTDGHYKPMKEMLEKNQKRSRDQNH